MLGVLRILIRPTRFDVRAYVRLYVCLYVCYTFVFFVFSQTFFFLGLGVKVSKLVIFGPTSTF